MKTRFIVGFLALVCLALSVVFGVIHDHHDEDGWCEEHHCTACQWLIGAVADVPLVFILTVIGILLTMLTPDLSVSIPTIFSLASASRGPPAASA